MPPPWLALVAPLPAEVVPQRMPVASAEQLANGTAGPIADWQSVTVYLSVPEGSRHILITVDGSHTLLSAGDHVLFVREPAMRDGIMVAISDHESVGGRYADDGLFHGTRWQTRTEQVVDSDDEGQTTSTPSPPSEDDTAGCVDTRSYALGNSVCSDRGPDAPVSTGANSLRHDSRCSDTRTRNGTASAVFRLPVLF